MQYVLCSADQKQSNQIKSKENLQMKKSNTSHRNCLEGVILNVHFFEILKTWYVFRNLIDEIIRNNRVINIFCLALIKLTHLKQQNWKDWPLIFCGF